MMPQRSASMQANRIRMEDILETDPNQKMKINIADCRYAAIEQAAEMLDW